MFIIPSHGWFMTLFYPLQSEPSWGGQTTMIRIHNFRCLWLMLQRAARNGQNAGCQHDRDGHFGCKLSDALYPSILVMAGRIYRTQMHIPLSSTFSSRNPSGTCFRSFFRQVMDHRIKRISICLLITSKSPDSRCLRIKP